MRIGYKKIRRKFEENRYKYWYSFGIQGILEGYV